MADNLFKRLFAGRKPKAPKRDTEQYPRLINLGNMSVNGDRKVQYKPTQPNIRYFSRTPYARAAIRRIRDPLCCLKWEIKPSGSLKPNKHLQSQIEVATNCFNHPNTDDSWRTMLGQIVEDWLVFGAGVFEQQLGGDSIRPLWMWPVDAYSIQIYPCWSGDPDEARYIQSIGYTNIGYLKGRELRNDELVYIKANDSTETPYGFGALEIAFNTINRQLGVSEFTGNLASNAQPQLLLHFEDADDATLRAFRSYWRNEVEGQGQTPLFGGRNKPNAVSLHPGGDDALYLKYQQHITREIAVAFGLSPMNLGIEQDVNRSTAKVAADRDWDNTIIPLAELIAQYLTREVLHAKLGFYQLEFSFSGLYREDEESTAKIYEMYYKNNLITPNEQRLKLGMHPLENQWADLTFADTQIALGASRGVGILEDKNLQDNERKKEKDKIRKEDKKSIDNKEDENVDG